ncbi:transcription factor mef2A-like isoform X2 [Cyanistes caeruleus]|uniref:transcription factor mef2A-like isoform X2 n=1 Tax=Cyanistes caeruleus TaxID=156563 RepID=UPI000CDADCC0|nr:transcription factor mef2A-like isoform X2 [Cyanistes caeruleus]
MRPLLLLLLLLLASGGRGDDTVAATVGRHTMSRIAELLAGSECRQLQAELNSPEEELGSLEEPPGAVPEEKNLGGNSLEGNNLEGNNPRRNNPRGNNLDGNNPEGNNPRGNNLEMNNLQENNRNNPKGNNPRGNNPRGNNPEGNNLQGNNPEMNNLQKNNRNNPRGNNPRGNNLQENNPKGNNPRRNNLDGNNPEMNNLQKNNFQENNLQENNLQENTPKGNTPEGNPPVLRHRFGRSPRGCSEALRLWLVTAGEATTWDHLVRALHHIGRSDIARELGKNLNQARSLELRRNVEGYRRSVQHLSSAQLRPPEPRARRAPLPGEMLFQRQPPPSYSRGLLGWLRPVLLGVFGAFLSSVLLTGTAVYCCHWRRILSA